MSAPSPAVLAALVAGGSPPAAPGPDAAENGDLLARVPAIEALVAEVAALSDADDRIAARCAQAVCAEWRSFDIFLAEMGPRPSPLHSIDRIDNDGHYEPGNCRWATRQEQMRNTCRNRWVMHEGRRVLLLDACASAGLPISVVWQRLNWGWPTDEALAVPVYRTGTRAPPIAVVYRDREMPLVEACRLARLQYGTVCDRLRAGWPVDLALRLRPKRGRRITRSAKSVRPIERPEKASPTVTYRGREMLLRDACSRARLKYETVQQRLRDGWPLDVALRKRTKRQKSKVF